MRVGAMNIPGFTTQALIELHNKIRECLQKDDENPSPDKVYEVRSLADWRQVADSIENELASRSVSFLPIHW